jgi:hypothetical protein
MKRVDDKLAHGRVVVKYVYSEGVYVNGEQRE